MTQALAGYDVLGVLWEDEVGTSTVARSKDGGPEVGLRLLRVAVSARAERRRLRGACLAVTALLPHPGILTVHEAGFTSDDRLFLVTDRPHAHLAGRLAAEGPLSVPEAAAIGHALAATLAAAHARGILHQGVQPEAVVWAAGPAPRLTDFGVTAATVAAGGPELSAVSLVHAARELFGWETTSPATDVHGLASTIYTMVAGRPPYLTEAMLGRAALYQRVLRGAPPPVPGTEVPARLSALLADMMAPDPGSRPAMPEVAAALAELAAPGPAAPRPPSVSARPEPAVGSGAAPVPAAGLAGVYGATGPEELPWALNRDGITRAFGTAGPPVVTGTDGAVDSAWAAGPAGAPGPAAAGAGTGSAADRADAPGPAAAVGATSSAVDAAWAAGPAAPGAGTGSAADRAGAAGPAAAVAGTGSPVDTAGVTGPAARSRYLVLALLLAVGVFALLAGIVWGVVTAPGPGPRPAAVPSGTMTAAASLSAAERDLYRPRQVTVQAGGDGVRVSWAAPGSAGAVSAYIVIAERGGHPAQEKTLAPSALGTVFTGLPPGHRYCFVVGSLLAAGGGQPETAAAVPACATVP